MIRFFNAESGAFLGCEWSPDLDEMPGVSVVDALYGTAITRLGDVILDVGGPDDGEEIAVGAPGATAGAIGAGKVYIYTVRTDPCALLLRAILVAPSMSLDRTGAAFGAAVSGPGDLDTGAVAHPPAEILVGAPGQSLPGMQEVGEAYIFDANLAGTAVNLSPRFVLFSRDPLATSQDRFGHAISGAGTMTGAGPDIVAVGVPGGITAGGLRLGRVELFDAGGTLITIVPNPTTTAGTADEAFGWSLAEVDRMMPDQDGFIVGNPTFFNGTNTPGEAYFFHDPTVFTRIPFSDQLPPPLSGEIGDVEFGFALAHSSNERSNDVGRTLISAITRDVQDAFGYRAANPRTHVNFGRAYLFRYVQQPLGIP